MVSAQTVRAAEYLFLWPCYPGTGKTVCNSAPASRSVYEVLSGILLLNEVSAFLWKKLENPVSRDDLLAALLDQYQVDEATAANDLDLLLEKLRSFDVIEDEFTCEANEVNGQ